jgi:hypothetical protein
LAKNTRRKRSDKQTGARKDAPVNELFFHVFSFGFDFYFFDLDLEICPCFYERRRFHNASIREVGPRSLVAPNMSAVIIMRRAAIKTAGFQSAPGS